MQLEGGIQKRNELKLCLLEKFFLMLVEKDKKHTVQRTTTDRMKLNIKSTLGHLQNF